MGCGCTGSDGFGAYFKDSTARFGIPPEIRAAHAGRAVSTAGLGRYFKNRVIVNDTVTRAARAAGGSHAGRVVGTDRWGRAIATDGFGAYYLAVPGQMFSGFGAEAFTFDANKVWSDWLTGGACDKDHPMPCVAAKRAVDSLRAALGQLGYGPLSLSVSWGAADQAAYTAWAQAAGLTVNNSGLPEQAHLSVMQTQVSQGMVTGPNAPISYSKVGDTIVQTAATAWAKAKGIGWKTWAIIGAAVVAGVVIYKKRKGKQYTSYKKTTAIEPYRGPSTAMATANKRRHRKNGRKGRRSWR